MLNDFSNFLFIATNLVMNFPVIDAVAFSLGPVSIHWYGLSYIAGILAAVILGRYRAKKQDFMVSKDAVIDLVAYVAFFAIIGGRLGYTLIYEFGHYAYNPLDIFKVWRGGMSFHGGFVGSIAGVWLYAYRRNYSFLDLTDFLAPLSAVGLFFGRIANFINQELWGRPAEVAWAIVFPNDPEQLPRHPSQIYEAVLEGAILFVVLWVFSLKKRRRGLISALFLMLYGVFRFLVEFTREPDAHLNFILWGWLTMGQLLSVPLVVAGIWMWLRMSNANNNSN